MDEKEANIDVLFRNGLKDYEVLPPGEAWENIRPVITKKQQPFIILRAAATIAVLISLGFLTYQWRSEFSVVQNNNVIQNPGLQPISFGTPENELLADAAIVQTTVQVSSAVRASGVDRNIVMEERNIPDAASSIYPLSGNELASLSSDRTRPELIALKTQQKSSISIEEYKAAIIPEIAARTKTQRWTIAALASPTYMSSFHANGNEIADQLVSSEQPLVSYAGGVALSYKVSRRLSVQSGLYYSSYGNELSGITSFGGFQKYDQMKGNNNFEVLTTNGTVSTSNTDIFLIDNLSDNRIVSFYDRNSFDPVKAELQYLDNSLRQNLGFIELPVILRYKFVDRTVDLNIIGGVSSNLLVNNSVYTSLNGAKYEVGKTEGLNTISFSSSLGMGMEYNFNENLSLNLEPTIRYFLNPFNSAEGMKIHPYSFGIFSGLSYKF